jgi:hypothetical protein
MSKATDPRVITIMPEALVARIDDYRFATRQSSRTAAIIELLEMALKQAGYGDAPPAKKAAPKRKAPRRS